MACPLFERLEDISEPKIVALAGVLFAEHAANAGALCC